MTGKGILDETSRVIISEMIKNGRIKYTELARKLKVTPAAIKERVERLQAKNVIKVSALLDSKQFFPVNATIGVEADSDGVSILTRKLRNCPLVFHLTKTAGQHNLIMSIVAEDLSQVEEFLNKQVRSEPGIKHVEVNIGNQLVVPEFTNIRMFHPPDEKYAPCGLAFDDEQRCPRCPAWLVKEEMKTKKEKP